MKKNWAVHHIDGNPHNNDLANVRLVNVKTGETVKNDLECCFWIIGRNTSDPVLACDLHHADGSLAAETYFEALPTVGDVLGAAQVAAIRYAAKHAIAAELVRYDPDSTQFSEDD